MVPRHRFPGRRPPAPARPTVATVATVVSGGVVVAGGSPLRVGSGATGGAVPDSPAA
ncbi:hypothetical protein [Micromonospora sp. SH-82]|uniref:hypothetical protein n=1 Tax=Micromonospora sp. SH-82 TaxID=3132938 RepID=UPI003EBB39A8